MNKNEYGLSERAKRNKLKIEHLSEIQSLYNKVKGWKKDADEEGEGATGNRMREEYFSGQTDAYTRMLYHLEVKFKSEGLRCG